MTTRLRTILRVDELEPRAMLAAPPQAFPTAFLTEARTSASAATGAVNGGIPRHYSHIRVAMLAYTGTPMTAFESKLLRESVDLLVPSMRLLNTLEQQAPQTPKLLYTNFTNIYGELFTDWLNYADRTGRSREGAFYHVSRSTPFTGDSGSSKPVNWFWSIRDGNDRLGWTDHTPVTKTSDTSFTMPPVGEAVIVGYPEKFREINVTLRRGATGSWASVLEYPSAVDAQGRPTTWRTLPTRLNSTRDWRTSGAITFDPPSDWKASTIDGDRLFYVRVRPTANSGTVPIVAKLFGRDYVRANGANRGTIPAFDPLADRNSDGYLNDGEYAQRRLGFDARFQYESRLFYTPYGQMRFATNPADGAFRSWSLDFAKRFLAEQPHADGLFLDNSYGRLQTSATSIRESITNYADDYATMVAAVNRGIGSKWLLANTAGSGKDALPLAKRGVPFIEEFALRPLAHNYLHFEDAAVMVAERLRLMGNEGFAVLDTYPAGGSPTGDRTQLASLAYYYLLADPERTFVMFNGGYEPSTSWQRHWTDAVKFDVGKPRSAWSTFAVGADPENTALQYRIYQRPYDRALVLYKPLSYAKGRTGTLADRTATTHQLGGRYRVLNANGTLGSVVTRITLRNGEGAILVKA